MNTDVEKAEDIQVRVYGDASAPTLVYLPGLHGDWTLVSGFRAAVGNRARFVEFTYPRSLTWSLEDYVNAVERALLSKGISHGWLIGESWGSQPAWALAGRNQKNGGAHFWVDGLILAGGFVKHPWEWGPGLLGWIGAHTPIRLYRFELKIYALYSKWRHRASSDAAHIIDEFVARRTGLDRDAMQHRLRLMEKNDLRTIAQQTGIPVHYLAGLVDPLVPWPLVRRWLGKNCPSYRGGKTFLLADHNVLATAPKKAADVVMGWVTS